MKLDDFFICYVENFANGWVEIQERTKLFFEYKRSFWFFLEQLQDASRQSVKYPKILQSLAEEKIAEASQRRKSGKEARKPEQSNADAPIFREHCTNETGYTLLDGCWFYRTVQPYLQDDANSPGYEPSTPLQCNDDYEMMKDKLQQCALEIKKNRAIEKLERDEMIKEAKNHPKRNDNQKKRDVRTIMEAVKWQPRFADVILTHVSLLFQSCPQFLTSIVNRQTRHQNAQRTTRTRSRRRREIPATIQRVSNRQCKQLFRYRAWIYWSWRAVY